MNVIEFNVQKFDSILARGLCNGLGERDGQMCIEAAICATLDLPHGDDPQCVASAVRAFKISLNDYKWSSPAARAEGLRDLGLAQLGSKGVVDDFQFARELTIKCVRILIPELFRLYRDEKMLTAIPACEAAETLDAAHDAASDASAAANYAAIYAISANYAANYTARAAARVAAEDAAKAAAGAARADNYAIYAISANYAAGAASRVARAANYAAISANYARDARDAPDYFLNRIAKLALEVLIELKSPGVALISA